MAMWPKGDGGVPPVYCGQCAVQDSSCRLGRMCRVGGRCLPRLALSGRCVLAAAPCKCWGILLRPNPSRNVACGSACCRAHTSKRLPQHARMLVVPQHPCRMKRVVAALGCCVLPISKFEFRNIIDRMPASRPGWPPLVRRDMSARTTTGLVRYRQCEPGRHPAESASV